MSTALPTVTEVNWVAAGMVTPVRDQQQCGEHKHHQKDLKAFIPILRFHARGNSFKIVFSYL